MRVFITHDATDDPFVTQLSHDLHDYRVSTWVDHQDIDAGEDWGQALLDALKQCEMMIVVLSPAATTSAAVRDQWQHHLEQDKPIVVVTTESCEIPPKLADHAAIDFTEMPEQNLLHLLRALGVNMPTQPLSGDTLQRHLDDTGISLNDISADADNKSE